MQLDAYQRCVGGADKKIKFCCGKEITGDLNSIFEAVEADQRAAALDRCNRAIQKHGDKDCLLATKVSVLIQLNETEQAGPLVDTLLERDPRNPVALGQKTTLLAIADRVEAAVDCLQEALEHFDRTISRGVLNAIRIVGALLHEHNNVFAARAHLVLYSTLATEPDPEVARLMLTGLSDASIPIFLKHDFELPIAPAEGSWSATYNAIRASTMRGRWKSSLAKLRELDAQHPGQPILRKAIAVLENRVGTPPTQAEAWRRYSETPGVPTEEAIEAEAIAQTLGGDSLDDKEHRRLLLSFPVVDLERALAGLAKHPRAASHGQVTMPHPDLPPPRAAYSILDAPPLADDEEIQLDTIPIVIGSAMIYGRETDREPRIEIEGYEEFGLDETIRTVREAVGDAVGPEPTATETIGEMGSIDLRMGVRWYLARAVEPELRRDLLRQHFVRFQNETWPSMPLSKFGGKTAREAAADPNNHRLLLAWLMSVEELIDTSSFDRIDLDPLRRELGLPERGRLEPAGLNLDRLPPYRFSRLNFAALSDDQLTRLMHIARFVGHPYVIRQLIGLKLERSGGALPPREEYELRMQRAMMSPHVAEGRADFERMEQIREGAEVPRGMHLVWLLDWALGRGAVDLLEKTMETLQRRHFQEPGIADQVARILVRHGVISPEALARGEFAPGSAHRPPAPAPVAGTAPIAGSAPIAPAAGSLWTPDEPSSPSGDSGSKLWLPGMD